MFKKSVFVLLAVAVFGQGFAFADEEVDVNEVDQADVAAAVILPAPVPYPPAPYPTYTCYAQNRRGQLFPAVGYDEILTQAAATRYCEANSVLRCTPTGCRANF